MPLRLFAIITLLLTGLGLVGHAAPASSFPLAQVRLLDGPFHHAQELGHRYLLALEPDRLLAGFRTEARLEPRAPKYPNWESSGLDGHTLGHYLTALAQMWAVTRDAELNRRLEYIVSELAVCQQAHGNGYVGAVPRGRELWADVAAGNFDVQGFSLKEAWVPWYNVHKTFAGLRDAWLIAEHAPARDVLIGLARWCSGVLSGLSDEKVQTMLRAEHGGMNEVLADLSAITGDRRYLALAQRFSHRAILDPLLRREDRLTGLHANTQIPKVIGFARIAELGGDPAWRDAAEFFWETVVGRRSVAFGGNSVREHFNAPDNFSPMIESREGPESCNTYNMLRLTEQLFRTSPDARFADYYERALYNHILGTQHPEHGGFVYFTPIRPRHYRVYSQPTQCFWCCVGSGIENHGKYGRFIYAHGDDTLWVNLFIASELDWPERRIKVRQETRFPDERGTSLTIKVTEPQEFALRVRHPAWVPAGALTMRVNGASIATTSTPSSYAMINRTWHDGDRLEVDLPMTTTLEALPDSSGYVALLHGPILLAAKTGTERVDGLIAGDARMGHVAPGPFEPLDTAPMLVGDRATMADQIQPVADRPLTFTAPELIRPETFQALEFVPFFRVHDTRYMMYWRATSPVGYQEVVASLASSERRRLDLERRTVDLVTPGEQQPEVEHNLRSENSTSGTHLGRQWRDATGWFSYDLRARDAPEPLELHLTTFGLDRGREFSILVNDREIAVVQQQGDAGEQFVNTVYPIPDDIVTAASDGLLTVKFTARPDSRAGAIYEVRLVRSETTP